MLERALIPVRHRARLRFTLPGELMCDIGNLCWKLVGLRVQKFWASQSMFATPWPALAAADIVIISTRLFARLGDDLAGNLLEDGLLAVIYFIRFVKSSDVSIVWAVSTYLGAQFHFYRIRTFMLTDIIIATTTFLLLRKFSDLKCSYVMMMSRMFFYIYSVHHIIILKL